MRRLAFARASNLPLWPCLLLFLHLFIDSYHLILTQAYSAIFSSQKKSIRPTFASNFRSTMFALQFCNFVCKPLSNFFPSTCRNFWKKELSGVQYIEVQVFLFVCPSSYWLHKSQIYMIYKQVNREQFIEDFECKSFYLCGQ